MKYLASSMAFAGTLAAASAFAQSSLSRHAIDEQSNVECAEFARSDSHRVSYLLLRWARTRLKVRQTHTIACENTALA
jgi:hypothetical protein